MIPDIKIYSHHSQFDMSKWRYPNFMPEELSCPCCGEFYYCEESINMIQCARTITAKPYRINSAHRCWLHNTRVGGAPRSEHKQLAFDISLEGHDRSELLDDLRAAGFTTFGFYQTFIHTDIRTNRIWYSGEKARKLWTTS